jgi:hypothetical protein
LRENKNFTGILLFFFKHSTVGRERGKEEK